MSHTEGPWHVETNKHPTLDGQRWGAVTAYRHPAGGGGRPPDGISEITWTGAEGLANARLLAAAPRLLAALQDAITACDMSKIKLLGMDEWRAAVAQVEGEKP